MRFYFIAHILIFLFLASCSTTPPKKEVVYDQAFMQKVTSAKELYRQGKIEEALKQLQNIKDEKIASHEVAHKRNLIGVIYFSSGKYDLAITNFQKALLSTNEDLEVAAQVHLNLAGSLFKLSRFQEAYDVISKGSVEALSENESKKFLYLKAQICKELGLKNELAELLIFQLAVKTSLGELKAEKSWPLLEETFFSISMPTERALILDKFEEKGFLVVGYLAYLGFEKNFEEGKQDEAKVGMNWIITTYRPDSELGQMASQFIERLNGFQTINSKNLCLVMPFSGKKKVFSERAMLGIDYAVNELKDKMSFNLLMKDSEGVGSVGASAIASLMEKSGCLAIIGGLFSEEATREYLEAKKFATLFISLSEINLPRDQKSHLLLEIPASIESLVSTMLSDENLAKFGKRVALLYGKGEKGELYADEFFAQAKEKDVTISNSISYKKEITDYQDAVKKLLDLKYPKARKEEAEFLKDIHSKEEAMGINRDQALFPLVDFDWVFFPATPLEAVQMIPSFNFYDAGHVPLVGDPSWRSATVLQESRRHRNLFFVSDLSDERSAEFQKLFGERYQRSAGLLEMRGYDALTLLSKLSKGKEFKARSDFDNEIRETKVVNGLTGDWSLEGKFWKKSALLYRLTKGEIKSGVE